MKIRYLVLSIALFTVNSAFSYIVVVYRTTCGKGPNGYENVYTNKQNVYDEDGITIKRVNHFVDCYDPGANSCPLMAAAPLANPPEDIEGTNHSISVSIYNLVANAESQIVGGVMTGTNSIHLYVTDENNVTTDYL